MGKVFPGRYTERSEQDVTVFLIGMRFNKPWRVDRWIPVFVAMPRMLFHLATHPQDGLLGSHLWFGRTVILLQYWENPEKLRGFAADSDAPHLGPWRRFMRTVGKDDAVGIWHETYVAPAGSRESIYVNMPAFGAAKALSHVQVGDGARTASQRMSAPTARDSDTGSGVDKI